MRTDKNIALLAWFNFFTDFVFFAPVAIIYFAKVSGSFTLGMSIFSLAYLFSALCEVPTGIISDLLGRKKSAVLGSFFSILCVSSYAIAPSYSYLVIGALFEGVSRAFYSGNNDALLHDTLRASGKEKEYHTYLGKTSGMFQIALAIATFVGGLLAARSFPLVMWASVIPQLAAFVIALQFTEPPHSSTKTTNIFAHLSESVHQFQSNYRLRMLTLASMLRFGIGEATFFLRSALINSLWPLWAVGISYSLSHIGGAFSFHLSGKVIDRYTPLRVLNFEIIFNRVVNLLALFFPTIISPALMSSTSLTYGAGSVAINSLMQKEFNEAQRATMSSLASFGGSIVFGVFSLILGVVADNTTPRFAMIAAHITLLLPLIYYHKVFTHQKAQKKLQNSTI